MEFAKILSKDNAALMDYIGAVVVLIDKDGKRYDVKAVYRDISQHIDAQSGFSLNMRQISAVISFLALEKAGVVYEKDHTYTLTGNKLLLSFGGETREFEISESRPDLTVGNFTLILDVCGKREKKGGESVKPCKI